MKTLIAACLGLAVLGGCGAAPDRTRYDDLEVVQRAAYRHDGPPALTLEEEIRQYRNPRDQMPAFPADSVSDEDVADIYAWLLTLE